MFYNNDDKKNQTSGLDIYMNDNYSGQMLIDNYYLDYI
jgi:hypothetical protein